jgi:hypothetical protein
MAFHDLNPNDLKPTGKDDVIEVCPICGGKMEVVYDRVQSKVCVCVDCHSGIAVPASALRIARAKREGRFDA